VSERRSSIFSGNRAAWATAMAAAAKLEMPLIKHPSNRGGIALAGIAGKLAGRQPRSFVPDAGLESGIEVDKLWFQARFTGLRHGAVTMYGGGGGTKSRSAQTRCLTECSCRR
jgi:hypothetical protein